MLRCGKIIKVYLLPMGTWEIAMYQIINKSTLSAAAPQAWVQSAVTKGVAFFDRLEAAISVSQAQKSRARVSHADMQTLGLSDL